MNLLLIFGGASTEHDVSRLSCSNVFKFIDKTKYQIHLIYITKDGQWKYIENATSEKICEGELLGRRAILSPDTIDRGIILLDTLENIKIDCVFPILHGKNGEDGTVQGLFELAKLPYVGCGITASANSMDKSLTKIIIKEKGVEQCPYNLIIKEKYDENVSIAEIENEFEYPVFVKPCASGSSVGVSKAKNREELKLAIIEALKYDRKVLVEKNIVGREIEVAVLGNEKPIASMAGEIAPESDFYSFDAKYVDNSSKLYIPARISEQTMQKVRENAIKVYSALDCTGLSRVDFFVTEDEQIIFNEINTLPGFTNISMYPKLFDYAGLKYSELIDELISYAMSRGGANEQ
ncbi:MAG: D-alanine--D-alanine ligase family protein [Clostridia bacterium]